MENTLLVAQFLIVGPLFVISLALMWSLFTRCLGRVAVPEMRKPGPISEADKEWLKQAQSEPRYCVYVFVNYRAMPYELEAYEPYVSPSYSGDPGYRMSSKEEARRQLRYVARDSSVITEDTMIPARSITHAEIGLAAKLDLRPRPLSP